MIPITLNQTKRYTVQNNVVNKRNRTRQNRCLAILISPKTVTIDRSDAKKKRNRKKDNIKSCARLTAKFLTTEYESRIIKFKMDEDLIQCRIYFLTFVESLEMIFSQNKETFEVLLDYQK